MSKCFECHTKLQKKSVLDTFNGKELRVEEWICPKCGNILLDLDEASRIYKFIRPPLSERISLLLSYPVEAVRKIAW